MSSSEFNEFKAHFPQTISQEIIDYATDVALLHSRYIFTRRNGRIQFGYCTHCNKEYMTDGLKHGQETSCKLCASTCKVKASGRGRKHLVDDAFFIWYEKSILDKDAIVARGIYVKRNYSGDYKKVDTLYNCCYMYLFEQGNAEMYELYSWQGNWRKRKSIISQFATSMQSKRCFVSRENIAEAVNGTPFQYCTWEHYFDQGPYRSSDMVGFFELAAKYPCIEYLTKLGMRAIVNAKLYGQPTYGAINWRGKSIDKVLRLTKAEAKEWVRQPFKDGLLSLYSYQKFKKMGLNLNFEQAHQLCRLAESGSLKMLNGMSIHAPIETIAKYILKQLNRKGSSRYYISALTVLNDWRDYLRECEELGMDIKQDSVLFPNNLHEAHQKTSAKIKFKRDEELNQRIIKRANELEKKFRFEHKGLIIRPASSNEELFKEGKALQHCVGGYAERYAEGKIDLLVVRKKSNPDKPFFTMEVRDDKVVQCRGLKNCSMTKQVEAFVDMFVQKKLNSRMRKSVNVVTAREEVAV